MRMKVLILGFVLAMTAVPAAAEAPAAGSPAPGSLSAYTVVDLGLYKGNPTLAHGINDGGRVVGQSGISPNALPMVWTKGNGWVPLNPLPGDDRGVAFAISNHREIGGWSGHGARSVAVVWDGTRMFQSPLVPGTTDAWGFAINDIREIVGVADASDGSHYGFFWCKRSGLIPVGNLPGMTESWASGINIYRRVVGWSGTDSSSRAFIWWKKTKEMVDLGTLPGWKWSVANAINDNFDVVGAATNADRSVMRAFLLAGGPGGTFIDLGTLGGTSSAATGLNELGQVVGWSQTASGQTHAFIWTSQDGMVDLGKLTGGTYSFASAINENGEIVGYGDDAGGVSHGLLFRPGM